MVQTGKEKLLLFSGSKAEALSQKLVKFPPFFLGKKKTQVFFDQEVAVQIQETISGQKVFVLQTLSGDPNQSFLEFLFLVEALKEKKAKEIVGIIPYLAYTRQDKKKEGVFPAIKCIAKLLKQSKITSLITVDVHSGDSKGFFEIPFISLDTTALFYERLKKERWKDPILCSPDKGGKDRALSLAKLLGFEFFCIEKRRRGEEVEILTFEGEVEGRDLIVVDDVASTGGTLEKVAQEGKKRGASRVVALISHRLPSARFPSVDLVFSTDTVENNRWPNEEILSVASLLQEAMKHV